jgi:hypothetical protein
MPEMGRRRFHRRVCADETVRGESYSRRHPQACFQNTSDKARNIRVVDFRGNAFRPGLVAGTEAGLALVRRSIGETRLAHVEAAVYVQDVPGDVRSHW